MLLSLPFCTNTSGTGRVRDCQCCQPRGDRAVPSPDVRRWNTVILEARPTKVSLHKVIEGSRAPNSLSDRPEHGHYNTRQEETRHVAEGSSSYGHRKRTRNRQSYRQTLVP